MIHLRLYPRAAAVEPAYCGERLHSTIYDLFGYYGPGNLGYKEVCPTCIEAHAAGKPVPPRETREEALARARARRE